MARALAWHARGHRFDPGILHNDRKGCPKAAFSYYKSFTQPGSMETKEWLYGKTLEQLSGIAAELGMQRYTAAQIASWIYRRGVTEIAAMSDLPAKKREALCERYRIGALEVKSRALSADGTEKYLFPTLNGGYIESALIPDGDRATLCVSSQAGCKMACGFCMTGKQGFAHNLTSGEILNQGARTVGFDRLTNIVYMGMGEPLDNLQEVLRSLEIMTSPWGYGWSPTRITVSTIGLLPAMNELLDHSNVHLAVSLHNPFGEERAQLMPLEKVHPIERTVEALKARGFNSQRRVSFEYIVLKGWNDSPRHVKGLCRLLDGLKCRINLIRFHRIPGSPFESPSREEVLQLRDMLTSKGIHTTLRASRGEDIQAACGLLSTKKLSEK